MKNLLQKTVLTIGGLFLASSLYAEQKPVTLTFHHFLSPKAPPHSKIFEPWARNLEKISNGKIILEKEVLENFTASFGVVAAHKNSTIDELLIKADKALYEAKESGRNRVCSFKE